MVSMIAGLALGLFGCDGGDSEFEQSVNSASDTMSVLMAGGAWPAPDETRGPKLEAVIQDLNEAMSTVDGDAKAPAQLMIARATAGQADISMNTASRLSSQISLDLTRADAIAREYSSNRSFASVQVGPDAGEASGTIEEQIRTIDAEIRDLEASKDELTDQLTAVQNEISQLMESARGERLQEADLRNESFDAEPMRRAELIGQAADRSRSAEAYERSAAEKQLTVESLEVAIAQVDRIIDNQQSLRAIQTRGLERITEIDTEIAERRREREQATQGTLSDYVSALDAVVEMYSSEFVGAIEAATSEYGNAVSMARQANAMGQLASAAAGEHASSQARAHELHAQLADRIASSAAYLVEIGADDQDRFRSVMDRFRGEADAARAAAADAYSESASGFSGAGSAGQTLSDRYQARAAELRGEEPPQPDDGSFDDSGDGPAGDSPDGSDEPEADPDIDQ